MVTRDNIHWSLFSLVVHVDARACLGA
jgi:hypothetical protein